MFQLPLGATAGSVRDARASIRRLLEGWGMTGLAETAELCTSELATNAVIHAHSPVLLTASSACRPACASRCRTRHPAACRPDRSTPSGRPVAGLALVDMLSTSWGVDQDDGGKTVWFELHDG